MPFLFATDYRALHSGSLGNPKAPQPRRCRARLSQGASYRHQINCNAVCIFQTFARRRSRSSVAWTVPCLARYAICSTPSIGVGANASPMATSFSMSQCWPKQWAWLTGLLELWNLGKFPFADELVPLYADHVARTVAACAEWVQGADFGSRRYDLGGVIGDDGWRDQNFPGDACGEAHLAIQRMALELRQRGIVLAVSSKNTYE